MVKFLEKLNRFLLLGKWYVIYTKWVIIGMLIDLFVIDFMYNVKFLDENFIILLKVHFFLSLYIASIPTILSFKYKETYNKANLGFKVGQTVTKISKKPFKSGLQKEVIVDFGFNEKDPKKRRCAIFKDGSSCNVDLLTLSE
jgi:hypothetical protein